MAMRSFTETAHTASPGAAARRGRHLDARARTGARHREKMGLLVVILLLEIWPVTMLIPRRIHVRRGRALDIHVAPVPARVSYVQTGLVILMVFAATAVREGTFTGGNLEYGWNCYPS